MKKLKLVAGKHYSGMFHTEKDIEQSLLTYLTKEVEKCDSIINSFFGNEEWSEDEVILFETMSFRKRVLNQQIKLYNK